EPTKSQKSTVRCRRSPAVAAMRLVSTALATTGSARDAPHSPQNLKGGTFSLPHVGQRSRNCAPHSPQYFLSDGFSLPQFEHRIGAPERPVCSTERAVRPPSRQYGQRERNSW